MVQELTDKHLAAINRGRKAKGLKPIRRKKTETKKPKLSVKTASLSEKIKALQKRHMESKASTERLRKQLKNINKK